jgi:hypothetical protein
MKYGKSLMVLVSFFLLLSAAGTCYFAKWKSNPVPAIDSHPSAAQAETSSTAMPAGVAEVNPQQVTEKISNFLGNLPPAGAAEAAGRDRTYIVSYQVAFIRKTPKAKVSEESLSYTQLRERDLEVMPPYVYFGEAVSGKYDPAQPEVIAVRATIDRKEVSGYIDAAKLWLEPILDRAESDRYMAVTETTLVRVVPDPSSPPVLEILQGEVVEAVGQIKLKGRSWIKARFNLPDRARYGFIPGSDLHPLRAESVNQSAVMLEEVPKRIRESKLTFSDPARQRLSQNGFYIEPLPPTKDIDVDDMVDSYVDPSIGEQFFVTSDLYLHSYHLIFDRMLQDIEEKKLFPAAKEMSRALAKAAENALNAAPASVPAVREAVLGDLLYFSVAAKLFDPAFTVADAVRAQTDAVVSRIQAADGELPSVANFLGLQNEDFTQYKVRGHYEKNEALQRYFRGMMWFGRHNFLLSEKSQTLAAILLPNLVEAAHETRRFETFDGLVTYLIGQQDKYTLAGYRSVNQKVFGTATPSFRELSTNLDSNLATFQRTAWSDLPAPQIVSVQTGTGLTQEERLHQVAGLQFLGQRYVLDAFILNQLTSPSVGSDANPRNLPSALDVIMLLGSEAATDLQQKAQSAHQWPNYDAQVAKLKTSTEEQLAKRSTFYEQWLYALKTLFQPTSSKQAFALRSPWQYKSLNTGLSSWTELKHDTILYAEQSGAEMGGGEEFEIPPYVPPEPKGYVEPNPAFFRQLTASIDQMLTLLKSTGFITDEYADKLTRFRDLTQKAEALAHKEISGEPINRDDYEWIRSLRWSFDGSLLLPRGADVITDHSLLRMALVADVATDAFAGRVLEEGIGTPQRIVVVVKDASGGTRLTVGYVYSWFEFTPSRRWSDSEWKKIIYDGDVNSRKQQGIAPPDWYSTFSNNAGNAS